MNTTTEVRRTVDVPELARILGLSKGSLYAALRRGDLRGIRLGRRWIIAAAEVERLLADGTGSPAEDREAAK